MPKKIAPETLAHLIKSFLRALPGGVLGGLPSEVITECVDDAGCERLLQALRPPERTLLCWIVRVVYEVASCTEENKMVPAPSPGTNVDWHVHTEDVHLTCARILRCLGTERAQSHARARAQPLRSAQPEGQPDGGADADQGRDGDAAQVCVGGDPRHKGPGLAGIGEGVMTLHEICAPGRKINACQQVCEITNGQSTVSCAASRLGPHTTTIAS